MGCFEAWKGRGGRFDGVHNWSLQRGTGYLKLGELCDGYVLRSAKTLYTGYSLGLGQGDGLGYSFLKR